MALPSRVAHARFDILPFRYLAAFPPFDGWPICVVSSSRLGGIITRARDGWPDRCRTICFASVERVSVGGFWYLAEIRKDTQAGSRRFSPRMSSGIVIEHSRLHEKSEQSRPSRSQESSLPERLDFILVTSLLVISLSARSASYLLQLFYLLPVLSWEGEGSRCTLYTRARSFARPFVSISKVTKRYAWDVLLSFSWPRGMLWIVLNSAQSTLRPTVLALLCLTANARMYCDP